MAERSAAQLDRALRPIRLRMRLSRMLEAWPFVGAALALAIGALAAARYGLHDGTLARFVIPALALGLVGALVPGLRRVRRGDAARLADRSHGLDDRLLSASSLIEAPAPTDFERAAIADALGRLTLDPARAVPLRGGLRHVAALLAIGVATWLAFVALPEPTRARAPRVASPRTRLLEADVVEATRAELAPIRRAAASPEVERTLAGIDALLDALARGSLDREEAFRRLDALATRLEGSEAAERTGLRDLARALGDRSERLESLVQAMRAGDPSAASRAMQELAARTRDGSIDRRELERMREAFARVAEAARERDQNEALLRRRRDELRREIEREPRLLERRRRELERLERELASMEEQRRELERLERELDESAEQLEREDAGGASDAMREAFEELSRMAREQQSEEQRQALARQIEQLREAMRRQQESNGGEGEGSPMQRFVLRAGGEDGMQIVGPSGAGGEAGGSSGSAGTGSEAGGESGPTGSGSGGDSNGQSGEGQNGQNGEGSPETVLRLGGEGQGDAILELPGAQRPGRGGGGRGEERGEQPYGRDHDPRTLDAPTELDSSGAISRVEGTDGAGATRSQVIRGAASSGFAGRGYRDVHADYSRHAEELLAREDVPPGFRYYVRRYFQLIRPREETSP